MFTVFTILANWSGLDLDILREIAERITSLTDYIAFRRVCTSWKSATTSMKFIVRDNPNPNQMPVLLPAERCSYNREFYSLSNHRIDEVYLPESIAKKCFSSRLEHESLASFFSFANKTSSYKNFLPLVSSYDS